MDIREKGLVLYKGRPALVKRLGERLEIETEAGDLRKVRPKDVVALHPGPLKALGDLDHLPSSGEAEAAWEVVREVEGVGLDELAELIYGTCTPATAWASWLLVADGLLFAGDPGRIAARSADQIADERQRRQSRDAAARQWEACLERLSARRWLEEDEPHLREVEGLALERTATSRVLRALGRAESPDNAHALLLELGYWDHTQVPYARRLRLTLELPTAPLPALPEEERLDLTHLEALAIDDEGNRDPDDAISLDEGRLWVHVADVAALVGPDSPADREARGRGTTLYLPDGIVPMLPSGLVDQLGLGLREVSPALSFGVDLNGAGEVADVQVAPSWVRVKRLTYGQAETRLGEAPLGELSDLAARARQRRRAAGAVELEWPEVRVLVEDGQVHISPLEPFRVRQVVADCMILAGEAAALYAVDHDLPFPFSTQEATAAPLDPETGMAGMFARRRQLRPGRIQASSGRHAALGVSAYTRATSPLRRYLDLVVHQQLRTHLRGDTPLSESEILERVGASEAVVGGARQAERLSNRHWALVYLMQNPEWRGLGYVVEVRGPRATVVVPELALEAGLYLTAPAALNAVLPVRSRKVDLPRLEAHLELAA
ncbi:MAG: RNB domain-containing ribonuclease [Gemmatimonadota bacterium]